MEKRFIIVKDKNINDNYYVDSEIDCYTNLVDGEEDANKTSDNNSTKIDKYLTKYDSYIESGIYSDFSKYRGSNKKTNFSTIIDESKGFVKEIFARTYINLSKQEFLKQTDKEIYSEDNYIKELDLIDINKEIIVSKDSKVFNSNNINENNINEAYQGNSTFANIENYKDDNNTGYIYNILDANYASSILDYYIIINSSFFDEKLIKKIYSNYLDKFDYQSSNLSSTILNKLKELMHSEHANKYKIIEGDEIRALEEYEKSDYYGLKKFSRRKDFFQTNFLGLDILLGLANTYYPSTGQAYNAFKIDIGDFKISQSIKSFSTNEPIIIENIQQMGFKLLGLIYSTHLHLEERKNENSEKINSVMEKIIDSGFIEKKSFFLDLESFYELLAKNKIQYQEIINEFHNNLELIKNYQVNISIFNHYNNNLKDCFYLFIDNAISEINRKFEDINATISLINEEIDKNKNVGFHPYLFEDYRGILQKIKSFFNNLDIKFLLEEKENLNEYQIKDRTNELLNFNEINVIQNLIEDNEIFDYIYTKNEKNFMLSYINKYVKSMKKRRNHYY